MQQWKVPDLAVAVFDRGSVAMSFCSTTGVALAPDAVFEAASLSKPVFAVGVLKLVSSHRLDLDKPLSTYLSAPYEHQQHPFSSGAVDIVNVPEMRRVTARMVLSHTSGLPNWARNKPLAFQSDPGERWSYSGEGYIYLQRVVEQITGRSIEAYLQQAVLQPLGMLHSSYVWQQSQSQNLLKGHDRLGQTAATQPYLHPLAPSTLYTTLGDYALFVEAALEQQPGPEIAELETEQVPVRPDLKLGWGLGVAIENRAPRSFFHWGSNPGFQSFFLCQPGSGRGVLFFTDSDAGLELVDYLVAAAVPGRHPSLRFPMLHPKD